MIIEDLRVQKQEVYPLLSMSRFEEPPEEVEIKVADYDTGGVISKKEG